MSRQKLIHFPRKDLMWQLMIAFMINILSLALPIMMLQVYDRIIPNKSYGTLMLLVTGVVTALCLDASLRAIRAYLITYTAVSQEKRLNTEAMNRFLNVDMAAYERTNTGTNFQNMMAIGRLREFYSGQAMVALIDLPFAFLFLGLIAYLGGWLALAPAALLAMFVVTSVFAGHRLKRAIENRSNDEEKKWAQVVSYLSSLHTIKTMSGESWIMQRFEEMQKKLTHDSYSVAKSNGFSTILGAAFGQVTLITTVTLGSLFVINDALSVGGLSACTLLAGRTIQPIQRVLGTWLRMQDLELSKTQVEEIYTMQMLPRVSQDIPVSTGVIQIQNASFNYTAKNQHTLDRINLNIEQGEVIAIKGEKGSGKTTLLQMIAGHIAPQSGSVMIGGIVPSLYAASDLVRHVGYMPQSGTIFKGTLLDNITGFRQDDITFERAKKIFYELGLDEVINQLPDGYYTMLSDNQADPIPPGVKQRIALLRVLLNRPDIILFDDADRTIDKQGYNYLYRLLGKLKGQSTLVLATHDENILSLADKVYRLDQGRLELDEAMVPQHLANLIAFSA